MGSFDRRRSITSQDPMDSRAICHNHNCGQEVNIFTVSSCVQFACLFFDSLSALEARWVGQASEDLYSMLDTLPYMLSTLDLSFGSLLYDTEISHMHWHFLLGPLAFGVFTL